MRSRILILMAMLTFSGCGLFRKSSKTVEKVSFDVSQKKDSISSERIKSDSIGKSLSIDKGNVVTETERTITTEKKGGTIKGSITLDRIPRGLEILLKDSAGTKISLMLDTMSNQLNVRVDHPGEKTTVTERIRQTENKNRTDQQESSTGSDLNNQVAVSSQERKRGSVSAVEKISKPDPIGGVIMWIGIAIAIVLVVWGVKKFILNK
ncbi:hypothetical protein ACR79B_20685 [Sphingobacterium spiritivorum]|uniref:hypothetical protein n=1 Tax=Sphingobacterium spiritivorum TaxID=258 RepID=UPI003DA354AB